MYIKKMPQLRSWRVKLRTFLVTCFLSIFSLHPVWADDTEIYFNSTATSLKPNLLFILDASGSMTWYDCADARNPISKNRSCNDGTVNGTNSRLDRMLSAMDEVLDNLAADGNVNVGLMRFSGGQGGRVILPVTDLSKPGVRDEIDFILNDMKTMGGTPTVGALYEANQYFAGQGVVHGADRAVHKNASDADKGRVSHPDSYVRGTVEGRTGNCHDGNLNSSDCRDERISGSPIYRSPVVHECQANYAVLLSDGEPFVAGASNNTAFQDTVSAIEGFNGGDCADVILGDGSIDPHAYCGQELVKYMYERNNVITHTIGFNVKSDWIRDLAAASGDPTDAGTSGQYYEAESSSDLVNAISGITDGISTRGTTVVAPTVTINQFTRLSHRDEVYLALFQPTPSVGWSGNLKKYKFNGADPTLKDADGNAAVSSTTGEFVPSSRSFWSASADGEDILSGGVAENLNGDNDLGNPSFDERNMYSNLEVGNSELTADGNRMNRATVSPEMTGAVDEARRDEHLKWLAGEDLLDDDDDLAVDDARKHIGDPLHSNPTVVTYGLGENGDRDNLDSLVFFGTNEGFLHAIDTNTGVEEYAFMPQDLLPNVQKLFDNESSVNPAGDRAAVVAQRLSNASQSSTDFGGRASFAIDGNFDGTYWNRSVTHTADGGANQPWWQAELDDVTDIADVTIWNRTDCCTDRLSDFRIFVSETPFTSNDYNTNVNDPNVWSTFHAGPVSGSSVIVPVGTFGRYIRIQKERSNEGALSLAEVKVYGYSADDVQAVGGSRVYGMDGDITLRTVDHNNNGLIEESDEDGAYLYVGMRRGGRNYYALDVSEKNAPEFLWSINGGQGDFTELGQSWSKPIHTKMKVGINERNVLVFGGGYDRLQDFRLQRTPDSIGRAIFIVDADTGELVWSGGNPQNQPPGSNKHQAFADMEYSIPADVSLVTDPATGYLSQMYVGDMGGRLFRFDINNGSPLEDLVDGGMIADFGEDGTAAGARRFFASPDLSLTRPDGELTINISIGSGYRAHPLDRLIDDKFFVMRYPYSGHGTNYGVENPVTGNFEPATMIDLFDTSDNTIGQGNETEMSNARDDLANSEGWFITMEDAGEKVLDTSSTFEGVVRFVSYVPVSAADPCNPGLGSSFFYALNLADGTPFEDLNEGQDDANEKQYRRRILPTRGIAPPVSTIFVEHDGTVIPTDVSGVNKLHEWDELDRLRRFYWTEVPE